MKNEVEPKKFIKNFNQYLRIIKLFPEIILATRTLENLSQIFDGINSSLIQLVNSNNQLNLEMSPEEALFKINEFYEDIIKMDKQIISQDKKENKYEIETFNFDTNKIIKYSKKISKLVDRIFYLKTILKEYQIKHLPLRKNYMNINLNVDFDFFIAQKIVFESIKEDKSMFWGSLQFPDLGLTFEELIHTEIEYLKEMLFLKNNYPEDTEGNTVYKLPDTFSYENNIVIAKKLESIEISILFKYLREFNVIGDFEDNSLATLAHYLTGYSKETLRKNFVSYFDFRKKEFKGKRNSPKHFQKVKDVLSEIIIKIDDEINILNNRKDM